MNTKKKIAVAAIVTMVLAGSGLLVLGLDLGPTVRGAAQVTVGLLVMLGGALLISAILFHAYAGTYRFLQGSLILCPGLLLVFLGAAFIFRSFPTTKPVATILISATVACFVLGAALLIAFELARAFRNTKGRRL